MNSRTPNSKKSDQSTITNQLHIPPMATSASEQLALHQVQAGINAFLAMQQMVLLQQLQAGNGQASSSSSSMSSQQQLALQYQQSLLLPFLNANAALGHTTPQAVISNADHNHQTSDNPQLVMDDAPTTEPPRQPNQQVDLCNDEKRQRDLTIIGKRWQYVSDVASFVEFEQLRCRHQVSRNRTFAHGIRYSCTQKTQMRSNCPYLLLCLFSDGAGEHSAPGVGTISVYSRNEHTHPVKLIKARQPRRFAKLAMKRRKEKRERLGEEEEEEGGQPVVETADGMPEAAAPQSEGEGEAASGHKELAANPNISESEFPSSGGNTDQLLQMLSELSRQLANNNSDGNDQ